eukprot:3203552-Heterocapsa_arctica.AAC.1
MIWHNIWDVGGILRAHTTTPPSCARRRCAHITDAGRPHKSQGAPAHCTSSVGVSVTVRRWRHPRRSPGGHHLLK